MSPADVEIVHSDEALAIVNKPAGLIVHPAPGYHGTTLVDELGDLLAGGDDPDRPGIVHRLDRDTSGLMIVARTPDAHTALAAQIADRSVARTYLALVEGRPGSRRGKIDAPLGRDHRSPERVVVGGRRPRAAVTHFEAIEALPRDTLLEVRLETGRTHQIRAHLQAIECPVAGDPRYGGAGRYGLERQFLHSHRLELRHPSSGELLGFSSALPADLASALERARAAG
ncbi:MAG: RluA family pseudouridine synthase [Solirubrobacterales bacterium]